jgi:HlyD family secretion protein
MQNQIFPKEIIENTSEAYLPKVSVRGQLIYTSVVFFVVFGLALLPFIKVDVSIRSSGILRTTLEKNELKTIVSGRITDINVKDNQNVQKGETLFELDTKATEAQLKLNQNQQVSQQTRIQDLERLLNLKNFDKLISLNTPLYIQQYNQLYFTLLEKKSQLKKAIQDLDRASLLYKQRVIPQTEMEEKQFNFDKLQAEYKTLIATQQSQWSFDLNTLRISLLELESQTKQLQQEKSLYQIKAPEKGTFQLTVGKYVGSYLQAGEVLGVISPDSNLVAECYLSPRDIGLIKKGMKVKLQIDAFNYNEWGFINAQIIDIDNDYILMQENPVFRVKCQLETSKIQLKNGFEGLLKRGMTLQARFVVTQRTLFQLLYDNVDDWINPMSGE